MTAEATATSPHPSLGPLLQRLAAIGVALVIALQIAWPLASDVVRIPLSLVIVGVAAATCCIHALARFGPRWTSGFVGVMLLGSFAAELCGVRTGYPFGTYSYHEQLGASLAGVPLVVPFAWLMMAYPTYVVARTITVSLPARLHRIALPVIGAFGLTAWDVFLDPQMIAQGFWSWDYPAPHLPGVPGIPLTNFAGWLLVSLVLMALVDALPQRVNESCSRAVPALLWLWAWIGGIIANMFFLGRPGVAVVGGLLMGVVSVWFLVSVRESA